MKKQSPAQTLLALLLILSAAALRLVPHLPDFTPITALALFGGAVFTNRKLAFLIPIGALLLSDISLQLFTNTPGFYSWGQLIDYGAFLLIVLLGTAMIRLRISRILLFSFSASAIFFIVSNLGVWLLGSGITYPHTLQGLMTCYIAAIPFLGNQVAGDLIYSGVLFGSYLAALRWIPALGRRIPS